MQKFLMFLIFAAISCQAAHAADYAGRYERKIDVQPASLVVESLSGGRIKFTLEAGSTLNGKVEKAQVSGVVPVRKDIAVFERKSGAAQYSMSMRFTGKSVFVIYQGTGFGPSPNVDPHGVYVKQQSAATCAPKGKK